MTLDKCTRHLGDAVIYVLPEKHMFRVYPDKVSKPRYDFVVKWKGSPEDTNKQI